MIDVLFSDSAAGALKEVKEDVYALVFLLDIGDLSKPIESRNELIVSLYSQIDFEDVDEEELSAGISKAYFEGLEELEARLTNGVELRVWVSDTPSSILGLYHLCSILKAYDNSVYLLELPKHLVGVEGIMGSTTWDEISPEGFRQCFGLERKLSKEEINRYSELWEVQVRNPYPLRILLNGQIVGVEEDYYDFLIERRLGEEPIEEARLIGELLHEYRIGINYYWYVKRIAVMIEAGNIVVIDKNANSWERRICKSRKSSF